MEILEFGIKRENEERRDGAVGIIFDPGTGLFAVGKNINGEVFGFFGGGANDGESMDECVIREVTEESGLHDFSTIEKLDEVFTHYRNNLKNVNRLARASGFLILLNSKNLIDTKLEEHENFLLTWKTHKEIKDNFLLRNINRDYDHWIHFLDKSLSRLKEMGYIYKE